MFVSADDITTTGRTSFELSWQIHPTVEWRGDSKFDEDPYRTLLSNDAVKEAVKWTPLRRWTDFATRYVRRSATAIPRVVLPVSGEQRALSLSPRQLRI